MSFDDLPEVSGAATAVLPENEMSRHPYDVLPDSLLPGAAAAVLPGSVLPGAAAAVLPGDVLPGDVLPGSVLPGAATAVLPGSVLPGSVLPGDVLPGGVLPGSVLPRLRGTRGLSRTETKSRRMFAMFDLGLRKHDLQTDVDRYSLLGDVSRQRRQRSSVQYHAEQRVPSGQHHDDTTIPQIRSS